MRTAIVKDRSAPFDLGGMARDMLRPWTQAYDSWRSGVVDLVDRRVAKDECRCDCAPDDCRCRCCVADSDLLVEARMGERRVIPITIENHWRREREIVLELSSWTRKPGVNIDGRIVTPASFTIEPCGEAQVSIVIEIGGDAANDRQITDVGECTVGYADLRVQGCDTRPIRIAVAVLPHTCDDHIVDCRCGCC